MIKDCITTIENGSSVFIFPEGTRSKTGTLRPFSTGAFVIAQRSKVAIQPIAISGTMDIMVKGSWMLNYKANVTITVLDEIPYESFKDKEASEIAESVRLQIAEYVIEHKKTSIYFLF
jgi:1-acyl-sn-glycerol-3-phosphate acyltransferase